MDGRLMRPHDQGNLEMVKYCVANECPIRCVGVCKMLPETVISRYSNTYAKKSKRLGIGELPLGRLEMVISTYSNILLSVSMINLTKCVCVCSRERSLGLFEVLARNRQSAVELSGGTKSAREHTIPTVYNTSSTTTARYQMVGLTKMESYTLLRKRKEITPTGKKSWNTGPTRKTGTNSWNTGPTGCE